MTPAERDWLLLAAKAAGYEFREFSAAQYPEVYLVGEYRPWNPLGDGEDALNLAADLKLHMGQEDACVSVWFPYDGKSWVTEGFNSTGSDKRKATRRAIVRCAAYLGSKKTS